MEDNRPRCFYMAFYMAFNGGCALAVFMDNLWQYASRGPHKSVDAMGSFLRPFTSIRVAK